MTPAYPTYPPTQVPTPQSNSIVKAQDIICVVLVGKNFAIIYCLWIKCNHCFQHIAITNRLSYTSYDTVDHQQSNVTVVGPYLWYTSDTWATNCRGCALPPHTMQCQCALLCIATVHCALCCALPPHTLLCIAVLCPPHNAMQCHSVHCWAMNATQLSVCIFCAICTAVMQYNINYQSRKPQKYALIYCTSLHQSGGFRLMAEWGGACLTWVVASGSMRIFIIIW